MRYIKNGIWAIMAVTLVITSICLIQPDKKNGTADSVFTSKQAVISYLKEVYSDEANVTVTSGNEKKLDCDNHNQSTMKTYYNDNTTLSKISSSEGICWAAATTSILEFYGATSSSNVISFNTLRIARNNGYWSPSSKGLTFDEQDNLLDKMFTYYDIDKVSNNDYYDIYDTLTEEIDDGRAVVFTIVGHTMSGCGYVPYTVKYSYKNWLGFTVTETETENFVIVNDTWAENRTRQYSYFPEREIGTNIINRWDFGISKMLND